MRLISRCMAAGVALLWLSACSTADMVPDESSPLYQVSNAVRQSERGCRYSKVIREPVVRTVPFTVVLGHGFLRSQRNMSQLAIALASAGVPVATLDFCHMKPWNGNHVLNASEMIAVANELRLDSVVYIGFSAGGLAALLAAADDVRARGLVLLDYVDQPPLGRRELATLKVPTLAIAGTPSSCNAEGRDSDTLSSVPKINVLRFDGASHCAFEAPTNWLCNLVCRSAKETDAQWRSKIIETVTREVIALAG